MEFSILEIPGDYLDGKKVRRPLQLCSPQIPYSQPQRKSRSPPTGIAGGCQTWGAVTFSILVHSSLGHHRPIGMLWAVLSARWWIKYSTVPPTSLNSEVTGLLRTEWFRWKAQIASGKQQLGAKSAICFSQQSRARAQGSLGLQHAKIPSSRNV